MKKPLITRLPHGEENDFVLDPDARGIWLDIDRCVLHIYRHLDDGGFTVEASTIPAIGDPIGKFEIRYDYAVQPLRLP